MGRNEGQRRNLSMPRSEADPALGKEVVAMDDPSVDVFGVSVSCTSDPKERKSKDE
jgi:hypothetical protein